VWHGGGRFDATVEARLQAACRRLGMDATPIRLPGGTPEKEFAAVLGNSGVEAADILWNTASLTATHLEQLVRLGIASSFAAGPRPVHDGGLLCYVHVGTGEILLGLVARILHGERVADIPAQQPREFHFAINLRTARALGITVPASMLVRAHDVFE